MLGFFWPQAIEGFQDDFDVTYSLFEIGGIITIPLMFAAFPPLWQLPMLLSGAGAAAGIAVINSLGNLSGFVGGYVVGWLEDLTGSFKPGMWVSAGFMALAGVIALRFRRLTVTAESQSSSER